MVFWRRVIFVPVAKLVTTTIGRHTTESINARLRFYDQRGPTTLRQRLGRASGVKRFCSVPSRNSVSAKDSDPTLQGHPWAASRGLRQKSAFAQPINYSGRRVVIPEECKITQNSQIAHVEMKLCGLVSTQNKRLRQIQSRPRLGRKGPPPKSVTRKTPSNVIRSLEGETKNTPNNYSSTSLLIHERASNNTTVRLVFGRFIFRYAGA